MYILMFAIILIFVFGFFALYYACGRRKQKDFWNHETIEKMGYGELADAVDSGRRFVETHEYENVEIFSYDGLRLQGILVPAENARGTIVLMHGWNSDWKLDFSSAFDFYSEMGLNLMIAQERAQGTSDGLFMTFGVKESTDAQSWVTYTAQRFGDDHPVFLGGISMGASSVLMCADADFEENVRGIIADCGFTSPREIIAHVINQMSSLIPVKPALFVLNMFTKVFAGFGLNEKDAAVTASRAKLPVLIIHGTADKFVPVEMGKRIFNAYAAQKTLVLVDGAGHGMSMPKEPERVKREVENFINSNIL